jgi:hypothetical protein
MIQSAHDDWIRWFYSNAPAAWISALIAVLSLLYVLRTKRKPRRLVIREMGKSSLIRISPSVRGKINISFAGVPIGALGQIDIDVFNAGSEAIQQAEFAIVLPEETAILDAHVAPEDTKANLQTEENKLTIRLPYLNSFTEHRQVLTLSILVDGKTSPIRVRGAGDGWSVLHLTLPSRRRDLLREITYLVALLLTTIVALWYMRWIGARYHIGDREVSWRAFRLLLPPALLCFIVAGLVVWRDIKEWKRRLRGWNVE